MTILPYDQNQEFKEGWLKTIEAIEKRCIRSFPAAIKQHKVYSEEPCSFEEITELVGMVRKHQNSYSKIHHRAILAGFSFVLATLSFVFSFVLATLSFVKDSIGDGVIYLVHNFLLAATMNMNSPVLIVHAIIIPKFVPAMANPHLTPLKTYILFWFCISMLLASMFGGHDRKQYARQWVFFKTNK